MPVLRPRVPGLDDRPLADRSDARVDFRALLDLAEQRADFRRRLAARGYEVDELQIERVIR